MTYYIFKWRDGHYAMGLSGYYRRDCVKAVEDFCGLDWKEIKKHGHRIVKVKLTITEI